MHGAPSSGADRDARVACLGFEVAALHAGHGSPATRKRTSPTRASEPVVHLARQVEIGVFTGAPHGRHADDAPDRKAVPAGAGVFHVPAGVRQAEDVLDLKVVCAAGVFHVLELLPTCGNDGLNPILHRLSEFKFCLI